MTQANDEANTWGARTHRPGPETSPASALSSVFPSHSATRACSPRQATAMPPGYMTASSRNPVNAGQTAFRKLQPVVGLPALSTLISSSPALAQTPPVTVNSGKASYVVVEERVTLSAAPERSVTIPITATNEGGVTAADYWCVPNKPTVCTGETDKYFTIHATRDPGGEDLESVLRGFGSTMPHAVTEGATGEATVFIIMEVPLRSDLHPPPVQPAATKDQVTLTLHRNGRLFHLLGYRPCRSLDGGNVEFLEWLVPTECEWSVGAGHDTYVDTDVLPGATYGYRIRAVNNQSMSQRPAKAFSVHTAASRGAFPFSQSWESLLGSAGLSANRAGPRTVRRSHFLSNSRCVARRDGCARRNTRPSAPEERGRCPVSVCSPDASQQLPPGQRVPERHHPHHDIRGTQ